MRWDHPDDMKIARADDMSPRIRGKKKLDWLVIQASFDCVEDGVWENLMPEDVPDWVKDEDVVGKMMEGKMVCFDPEKPYRWYRVVKVEKPREH